MLGKLDNLDLGGGFVRLLCHFIANRVALLFLIDYDYKLLLNLYAFKFESEIN